MPKNRYFLEEDIKKNSVVILKKEEFHHLHNVMRNKKKDQIEIVNGRGVLATAIVQKIEKDQAFIFIKDIKIKKKDSNLALYQPFLPFKKLKLILEKVVELGVDKIFFYPSDNSEVKKISRNYILKLKKILISAMKQSGRLYLSKIFILKSLKDFTSDSSSCYFADIDGEKIKDIKEKNVSLFIGPEKGFSEKEKNYLQNKIKAKKVCLNKNILKAETASIVMCSFFSYLIKLDL